MAELWDKDIVKKLATGKVHPALVDFGNHWLVIKNLGAKTPGKNEIIVAGLPRPTFGAWLEEAKKGVVVKRVSN